MVLSAITFTDDIKIDVLKGQVAV